MAALDVQGSLYSARGLRFGGFQTAQFMTVTADLEARQSGIRAEIVAEAHHLVNWLHRFPEITFLVGAVATRSILLGLLCSFGGYVFEIARFYLLGSSPLLSRVSWLWVWLRPPIFLGTAIATLGYGASFTGRHPHVSGPPRVAGPPHHPAHASAANGLREVAVSEIRPDKSAHPEHGRPRTDVRD